MTIMLAAVREFTARVRRRQPFEVAVVLVLGLAGLAMSGTSSRAYHSLRHTAPLTRPVEETGRITRIVIVQASAVHVARPLVRPLPPAPPPRLQAPQAAPPPDPRPAAPPARVRGPPVSHA